MKQTSDKWAASPKYKNTTILDPDGWDRSNFQYSFHQEEITEKEFQTRLNRSTIIWKQK